MTPIEAAALALCKTRNERPCQSSCDVCLDQTSPVVIAYMETLYEAGPSGNVLAEGCDFLPMTPGGVSLKAAKNVFEAMLAEIIKEEDAR